MCPLFACAVHGIHVTWNNLEQRKRTVGMELVLTQDTIILAATIFTLRVLNSAVGTIRLVVMALLADSLAWLY
jgi:hypothetical protein